MMTRVAVAIGCTAIAVTAGELAVAQEQPKPAGTAPDAVKTPAEPKTTGLIDKELEGAVAKIRERKIDEAFAMIQRTGRQASRLGSAPADPGSFAYSAPIRPRSGGARWNKPPPNHPITPISI